VLQQEHWCVLPAQLCTPIAPVLACISNDTITIALSLLLSLSLSVSLSLEHILGMACRLAVRSCCLFNRLLLNVLALTNSANSYIFDNQFAARQNEAKLTAVLRNKFLFIVAIIRPAINQSINQSLLTKQCNHMCVRLVVHHTWKSSGLYRFLGT
jgi:hypothetical protein